MPQVFISHSSKDREFVEQELVPLLEHHSVKTWYSRAAVKTAAQWEEEIARAQLLALWDQELQIDRTLTVKLEVGGRTGGAAAANGVGGFATGEVLIVGGALIGSDPTAEIHLSDVSVSRRHAELKVRFQDGAKSLWLIDLKSTNGVSLNGVQISEPVILQAGDVIGIGEVQITVASVTL